MKYHLIGDQGVSMRGIKKYLLDKGNEVSGSDLKTTGHSAKNITDNIDLVIRSSAINPGSQGWVEIKAAQDLGIKIIKRSEFLGELTKQKRTITVSGMHGKTTITTMIGLLLVNAGYDPTVLVGERVKDFDDDVIKIGKSDWLVLEACEYDRSFLDFFPEIAIITNIEEEHLDTYPGGLPEIKESFSKFVNNVSKDGLIIACADDENLMSVLESMDNKPPVIYYGFNSEKYNHLDLVLKVPGKHNIQNALAVLALADFLGISDEAYKSTMESFSGAHRRFELLGKCNEADIIDDYGHHPTEIKMTIEALNDKYPDKKKIVVFWPHQYKRILPLLDKFASSFEQADQVIIKPIYFVPGRDEVLDISSKDLVDKINKLGQKAVCIETDEEIVKYLKKSLDKESVLLTIGIPPVYKIGLALISKEE